MDKVFPLCRDYTRGYAHFKDISIVPVAKCLLEHFYLVQVVGYEK